MRTWSEDHPKARLLERKQEAIKVAAKELFLRHGYANTTMEMVAAHAGVSIMTLYRHFRGKDVLFQAVIQHLCNQKAKEGREMFWQGNPAEVLRRLGQLRLVYALNPEEIALYQVILGAMEYFPEVGRMYYHLSVEKALADLSAPECESLPREIAERSARVLIWARFSSSRPDRAWLERAMLPSQPRYMRSQKGQ